MPLGALVDEISIVRTINRTEKTATVIGDTELIAAQIGKYIRALALFMRTAASVTVFLKSGPNRISTDLAMGINDDIVLPWLAPYGWFQTGLGESLVLNQSLAVSTGVFIVWIAVN